MEAKGGEGTDDVANSDADEPEADSEGLFLRWCEYGEGKRVDTGIPFFLYHIAVMIIRLSLVSTKKTIFMHRTYAGATADSKQPRSTLTATRDPKFLQAELVATQTPQNITSQGKLQMSNKYEVPVPLNPKYFAVGNLCIRYPVGVSKAKYVI